MSNLGPIATWTHFTFALFRALERGRRFLPLLVFLISPPSHAALIRGEPVGCGYASSPARMERVRLSGKVLLDRIFLPESESDWDPVLRFAAELQIKHLLGFFKNTRRNGLDAALSAYRGNLKILSRKSQNYGISQDIDRYLPVSHGDGSFEYVARALQRGRTQGEDPAVLARYEVDLILADCSRSHWLEIERPSLPLDPFLSLWTEKKADRKPRTFGLHQLEAVSGCSSSEIVDFGNSESSWFFWSPVETRTGSRENSVRCKADPTKLYRPDLVMIEPLPAAPALSRSDFEPNRIFRFAAVFGIISHDANFEQLDLARDRAIIEASARECGRASSVPDCLTFWTRRLALPKGAKRREPGLENFLQFLKKLPTVMRLHSIRVTAKDPTRSDELEIEAEGRFLDADQRLRISAFFGRTNLDYGPAPSRTYLDFVHDALVEADAIAYLGHSGLGQNVRIESFARFFKNAGIREIRRSKPLWFGIYNCQGFSYYGFDQDQIFDKGGSRLILTQSSGPEASVLYALAQLSALNQAYSGRPALIRDALRPYVRGAYFQTELWITDGTGSRSP